MEAASRVKKITFSTSGFSPTVRAWFSSKNTTMKSRHFSASTMRLIPPISASWIVSSVVIARILPSTMVWIFTEVGESDTMNSPSPKNEVKISPMIASSFSRVFWFRNSMEPAASPPERNAPSEKGRPSI
ncbi:hypothetical protein D3C86_1482480 [compost metagenome]